VGLAVLTQQSYLIDHHQLMDGQPMRMAGHYMRMGGLHLPWVVALAIFLASWQVMTVAMMLPASLPVFYRLAQASQQQGRAHLTLVIFLAGYATIWSAFALVAFLGDGLVSRVVDAWPWLADRPWAIGAATWAVAGGYEFSPLKARCLQQCRGPVRFVAPCGRRAVGPAWRLGLHHGAVCLGSCWALMLIMFGVSLRPLAMMGLLTGVMLLEQAVPGGQRFRAVVGNGLLLAAAVWLVHPAGLPGSA
jgi:predicted metal-binding membrane protein